MKFYENLDNFKHRTHTIEITLQLGEYKGTIKKTIGGNCFGLSVLQAFDVDDIEEDEKFLENNCKLNEHQYFNNVTFLLSIYDRISYERKSICPRHKHHLTKSSKSLQNFRQ